MGTPILTYNVTGPSVPTYLVVLVSVDASAIFPMFVLFSPVQFAESFVLCDFIGYDVFLIN